MKKTNTARFVKSFAVLLLMLAVLSVSGRAAQKAAAAADAARLVQLEEALHRAAVQCYALEGAYPESVDYLYEHYMPMPDLDRFTVRYEYMAENLMPEITVLSAKGGGF